MINNPLSTRLTQKLTPKSDTEPQERGHHRSENLETNPQKSNLDSDPKSEPSEEKDPQENPPPPKNLGKPKNSNTESNQGGQSLYQLIQKKNPQTIIRSLPKTLLGVPLQILAWGGDKGSMGEISA